MRKLTLCPILYCYFPGLPIQVVFILLSSTVSVQAAQSFEITFLSTWVNLSNNHAGINETIEEKTMDCPCSFDANFSLSEFNCEIQVVDNSEIPNSCKDNYTYNWNFGDGSSVELGESLTHYYQDEGVYNICLEVIKNSPIDSNTCREIICQEIGVKGCDDCGCSVMPAFNLKTTNCEVQFTDYTIGNECTVPYQWAWDFGDGSTSTEQHPSHVYATDGVYEVCLKVRGINSESADECEETWCVCKSILIENCEECKCAMAPGFMYSVDSCAVSFSDLSYVENCLEIVSWDWDFGDGELSGQQNPVHSYETNGSYDVCLKLTALNSSLDSLCEETWCICKTVLINDCGVIDDCGASIVSVVGSCVGQGSGSLTAQGSGGMPPYQYSLDNVFFQSVGQFNNLFAGSYTVFIKDAKGCSINLTAEVPSTGTEMQATISIDQYPGCSEGALGSISIVNSGGIAPYSYSIGGDFQSSSIFEGLSAGSYLILIQDVSGCTNSFYFTLPENNDLQAFIVDQQQVSCAGLSNGSLTIQANGGVPPYLYTLNDGPSQAFGSFMGLGVGTYSIEVMDQNGCATILTSTIEQTSTSAAVDAGPDQEICLGGSTVISTSSSGSFSWSPATGLSCADCPSPIANPTTNTLYTVSLTDNNGCTSTDQVYISITKDFNFDLGPDIAVCPNDNYVLNTSPPGNYSYYWQPTTGLSCFNCPSPTVSNIVQPITYTVIATNGNCMATDEITISVNQLINADFSYSITSGLNVSFSAMPNGLGNYSWDFGDLNSYPNNTASGQQVNHTFSAGGQVYIVCLLVENECGPFRVCHPIFIDNDCAKPGS